MRIGTMHMHIYTILHHTFIAWLRAVCNFSTASPVVSKPKEYSYANEHNVTKTDVIFKGHGENT